MITSTYRSYCYLYKDPQPLSLKVFLSYLANSLEADSGGKVDR
jgi:hypothetical protein